MALQEGGSHSISQITSWLKTNNLEPLVNIFQDRAITVDELYEILQFGDDDFIAFAKELSNDENIQQTLFKAAKTINIKPEQNINDHDNNMAAPDIISIPNKHQYPSPTPQKHIQLQSQHVIVSPAEHEAISSLYERYDFVSKLRNEIQQEYQQSLTLSTENTIKSIQHLFDNILMPQIENKKNELLNSINQLNQKKETQLKQQLIAVQQYLQIVDKGKRKYDVYIDDTSMDINSRKELIVNMINEILHHPDAYNWFITEANIKFNDFTKKLNLYYDKLLIDDCDQPLSPRLKIIKIGFSTIKIEWKMDDIDIFGAKPVLEFDIQYAMLPKSFRKKISIKNALKKEKKKNKKRQKKKRKKYKKKKKKTSKNAENSSDSDSDSDSTSESVSDSDSDSSSKSDDEKQKFEKKYEKFDENALDIDTLKWVQNEKKFRVKTRDLKKNKKFKYTFDDLRDEWPYIIRVRGRNCSGWGKYCSILSCQTNKLVIDSKILNNKLKIQLMKFVPNGKKRKWRLLLRASKHGFASNQFHQRCDGKGPTIIVIKSQIGNIFGGYTEVEWSSQGNYKFDAKAFIYLLKHAQRKREKAAKWSVRMNNNNSVYHNSGYGATFGGGHDLYLCSNCNNTNSSYSSLGSSYQAPKDNNLLAGSYNFMVTDYEVFQLTKK